MLLNHQGRALECRQAHTWFICVHAELCNIWDIDALSRKHAIQAWIISWSVCACCSMPDSHCTCARTVWFTIHLNVFVSGSSSAWTDIDTKLDVSLSTYDITQLVSMSLFNDDSLAPAEAASAPDVSPASAAAGENTSEQAAVEIERFTFAEFGVPIGSPVLAWPAGTDRPLVSPPEAVPAMSPSVTEPVLSAKRAQLSTLLRVIAVSEPAVKYKQVLCARAFHRLWSVL